MPVHAVVSRWSEGARQHSCAALLSITGPGMSAARRHMGRVLPSTSRLTACGAMLQRGLCPWRRHPASFRPIDRKVMCIFEGSSHDTNRRTADGLWVGLRRRGERGEGWAGRLARRTALRRVR
jgi:hypothetical protein